RGGAVIEVKSTKGPAPLAELRAALPAAGGHDGQVQSFGSPDLAGVRFRTENNSIAASEAVRSKLQAKFPSIEFKEPVVVGAKVSGELLTSGFMALGIALALMLA